MKISVIIPTHNRPEKLQETVAGLRNQNFPAHDYEIIIVDDGSNPPAALPKTYIDSPKVSILRLKGGERSLARNTGANSANGDLLIFVDDDISVNESFLLAHWSAHQEYPKALAVGKILLPSENGSNPFLSFRQNLEQNAVPPKYGLVEETTFCAAGNASINSKLFQQLSGFDSSISSGEDQDLAIRHTAKGGRLVYVPEAIGIHRDNAMDIRTYCRRSEWGSKLMLPFYQRYPNLPINIERKRVNGRISWKNDPLTQSSKKLLKSAIASSVGISMLFLMSDFLERVYPQSRLLNRVYESLLGAHIFRGYRSAIKLEQNGHKNA